jgi:hypothetical protein
MTLGPAHQQQERGQKLNIKVGLVHKLKGQRHESDTGTRTPAEGGQKLNIKVGSSLIKGSRHESDIGTRTPAAGRRTEAEHQGGEFIKGSGAREQH